ncbi:MAG: ribonuclease HII [Oscillospiraceae bacterium]|nr:ribonuclease HII [Oscillospiraceae bacterium]
MLAECNIYCRRDCASVCGVDEAGRGPLAGAVFAAAVILHKPIISLDDSKKLSPKRRDELYQVIVSAAASYCVDSASVKEIEETDILSASQLAMRRAVDGLSVKPELALIDGNTARGYALQTECVIGGDGKCACIAAASILAKVERDRYMLELAEKYPQYGFERHKGYGTKLHIERIREYGSCPEHRAKFLRKL